MFWRIEADCVSAQRHFAYSGKSGMHFDTNVRQRLVVFRAQSAPPPLFRRPAKSTGSAGRFVLRRKSLKRRDLRLFSFLSLLPERDAGFARFPAPETSFIAVCLYCRGHKSTAFRV